jgi:hypothetical protein
VTETARIDRLSRFPGKELLIDLEPFVRTVGQSVSRWIPTTVARILGQVNLCGICGGLRGNGLVFSEYFGFPCPFSFHRMLHIHHHLSSGVDFFRVLRFPLTILIQTNSPHSLSSSSSSSSSSGAGPIGQTVAEYQVNSVSPHAKKPK